MSSRQSGYRDHDRRRSRSPYRDREDRYSRRREDRYSRREEQDRDQYRRRRDSQEEDDTRYHNKDRYSTHTRRSSQDHELEDWRRSNTHEEDRYRRQRSPQQTKPYNRPTDNNRGRQEQGGGWKGRKNNEPKEVVVFANANKPEETVSIVQEEEEEDRLVSKEDEERMKLTDDEEYEMEVMRQMEMMEQQEKEAQREQQLIEQRRKRLLMFSQPETTSIKQEESMDTSTTERKPLISDEIPLTSTGNGKQSSFAVEDDLFNEDEDVGVAVDGNLFTAPVALPQMIDEVDDAEGYYSFRLGDVLSGRYEVFANQGKGVFSTVLKVRDRLGGNKELVLKVIRRNDVMYKAGQKEIEFLNLLQAKDVENKKHVVRLYSHFEHRNHLCLVFEPMHMNLRELLKKFGGQGVSLEGIQVFAKHLMIALRHLKKTGIVHADLKPDNILVNEKMNLVKICDMGSALKIENCEPTPVLVSRFYRAPEISKFLCCVSAFLLTVW